MTVRNELTDLGRVERRFEPAGAPPTPAGTHLNAPAARFEALEKSLHALSGSLARLERKLDRVLALSVESRGRSRQ
jgi:hypothetical protein